MIVSNKDNIFNYLRTSSVMAVKAIFYFILLLGLSTNAAVARPLPAKTSSKAVSPLDWSGLSPAYRRDGKTLFQALGFTNWSEKYGWLYYYKPDSQEYKRTSDPTVALTFTKIYNETRTDLNGNNVNIANFLFCVQTNGKCYSNSKLAGPNGNGDGTIYYTIADDPYNAMVIIWKNAVNPIYTVYEFSVTNGHIHLCKSQIINKSHSVLACNDMAYVLPSFLRSTAMTDQLDQSKIADFVVGNYEYFAVNSFYGKKVVPTDEEVRQKNICIERRQRQGYSTFWCY